jgi:acylphosphatase
MKQCVKIVVSGKVQSSDYREFVKDHAQELLVEGTIQKDDEKSSVVIFACGSSDNLDTLIDFLYRGTSRSKVKEIQVEPLIASNNFRGVFRIIGN